MVDMPAINTNIPEDLDKRFREMVSVHYGVKKGSMQQAIMDAMELLIKEKAKGTT
jgi:hypothetical protein